MPKSSTIRLHAELVELVEQLAGPLDVVHQDALGDLEVDPGGVEAGVGEDLGARRRPGPGGPSWRADRFTLTKRSSAATGYSACQRWSWRQACSSTHRPMGTMRPVSSATRMNSSGTAGRAAGCSQRSRASTPTMRAGRAGRSRAGSGPAARGARGPGAGRSRWPCGATAASRMRWSNMTARARPPPLAWYMAASASRIRSLGLGVGVLGVGDADAHRHEDLGVVDRRAAGRRSVADPLGDELGVVPVVEVLAEDRRTRRRRSGPRCRPGAGPRRRRSAVSTSSWSPAPWPRLSLTTLKWSRSQKRTATPVPVRRRGRGPGEAVEQQRAVGQAGERVVGGLVLEPALEALPLADVAGDHRQPADLAVGAPVGQALDGDRDLGAVAQQRQLAGPDALVRAVRGGPRG